LIGGSLLGGSSLPELLTYSGDEGSYEVMLPIEKEHNYSLVFSDTAAVWGRCRYFKGTMRIDLDKTKKSQVIDASFSGNRCD